MRRASSFRFSIVSYARPTVPCDVGPNAAASSKHKSVKGHSPTWVHSSNLQVTAGAQNSTIGTPEMLVTTHRSARLLAALPRTLQSSIRLRPVNRGLHTRGPSVRHSGECLPLKATRFPSDMLSGLKKVFGQADDGSSSNSHKALFFSDTAPSWDMLEQMVRAQEQEFGISYMNPDLEKGPTHPLSLKRTFGKSEPIEVKLYRDHAGWCPYCQKVWLQLEEKQIPYVIEKINMRCYGGKPPEFLAKVPSGLLPVLEVDGRVITESAVIMSLLEERFPDNKPLMPSPGTPDRARADGLMRLERRFFGDWLDWLCSGWNQAASERQFESTLMAICNALEAQGGPYFLGPEISLVDITFAPMLERAAASLAYYKGYYMRGQGKWPAIDSWFDAMESRSTYLGTRSDYYTHCHDLPPQLGGCHSTEAGEPVAAAIDGGDWHLPLSPLSSTSMPEPYSLGEQPERDRLQAAARMVAYHGPIVKFAVRGCGQPGPRPVSAPLSDPTAIPDMSQVPAADAALRHVVHALLVGVEAKQLSPHALQVSDSASEYDGTPIVSAAEYLRDRVGVPRDMQYPAARQLRAHLNWLIDTLQGSPIA
eukprot:jgi/Chrzof1/14770/Cz09g15160.t1